MPSHILPTGTLLSGYRIDKPIGGGGFSIVYLARDLQNQQQVVVKEYLPTSLAKRLAGGRVVPLSDDTAATYRLGIRRFFDEASALAQVHHRNIVRVTNVFRANNTVYIVMQYEHGKDLRWYVKRHSGRLSEKFIRTVFPPLLHGLQELHDRQLLHLDIKPANILLRAGGNPLLLDFGAAQRTEERNPGPGTLTAGFAPIEQHNREELGPWTDMYAIGASMWACMSGKAPPPAPQRVAKDKYKPAARTYSHWYSRELLEAIDWCLEIDRHERPQNVQQLLDILTRPTDHESSSGLFDTAFSYFARLWLKRPWNRT